MKKTTISLLVLLLIISHGISGQNLNRFWDTLPEDSKPWTFWYWMQGAVTKEGITADLEAMKEIGLGGAYLMPIKGVPEKPFVTPIVEQLSPLWWEMVNHAFNEADRLGLKIGFHICDGFALAGGPWITPELSMQKIVWSQINIEGGKTFNDTLPIPENYKGYYKDIRILAYPTPQGEGISTQTEKPKVTSSIADIDPQFLADKNTDGTFRSDLSCWIKYSFDKPFTCRTVEVDPSGNNFQSQRLTIFASDDDINYKKIVQLEPPRQGWQNGGFAMTHSIPPTTAKYFRFNYDKSGTEPGAEDVDAAKWKQTLKIKGIYMSSEARIHQYEGKNGSVWRVSPRTTANQISDNVCLKQKDIVDIIKYVDNKGRLNWKAPKGKWTILRMGHTSTGYTNATGGKGSGLECDKFNPEAIRLQFNSWFGKAVELAGSEIASKVLKVFHVDSWECGSQNWSPVFRDEFKARRGYDIYDYLPIMAGIPIESADVSERILYDVRQTISELVVDKFYAVLKEEANAKGCQFSAECVSPTMLSDGMMHYKNTDIPMNEYWLESPTHDKPNDVLDAISAAHIYGKKIIQAEAFTQLRMMFTEHPGMLKTLQDRHYALGINRLSYHVNVLNPWIDRKPGMTLDGIGLMFQRNQTWWKPGAAWIDYAKRCQTLLQYGNPVVDIAVFTGEEFPRRAMLPDRLVPFLPGLFGIEKVEWEKKRLANVGEPTRQMPAGVTHSANITGTEDWINALRGYQYDSFNADALLNIAKVDNGQIVLQGGMKYNILLIPGKHPMQPDADYMSEAVASKIKELSNAGAKIMVSNLPAHTLNYTEKADNNRWCNSPDFIKLPYTDETLDKLGIERDFIVTEAGGDKYADKIAYTHRQGNNTDIYFISNQLSNKRQLDISLRESGRIPELWNPVTGEIKTDNDWEMVNNRTNMQLLLEPNESVFIVLQTPSTKQSNKAKHDNLLSDKIIDTPWNVQFDNGMRGPANPVVFKELADWSQHVNDSIRYYSGTAIYTNDFIHNQSEGEQTFIEFDEINNMAEVKINGKQCGTIWTYPYKLNITDALRNGKNEIEILVTNTWANRIMGDEDFGQEKNESHKTWTNARYRLPKKELVKSGLTGNVKISTFKK